MRLVLDLTAAQPTALYSDLRIFSRWPSLFIHRSMTSLTQPLQVWAQFSPTYELLTPLAQVRSETEFPPGPSWPIRSMHAAVTVTSVESSNHTSHWVMHHWQSIGRKSQPGAVQSYNLMSWAINQINFEMNEIKNHSRQSTKPYWHCCSSYSGCVVWATRANNKSPSNNVDG